MLQNLSLIAMSMLLKSANEGATTFKSGLEAMASKRVSSELPSTPTDTTFVTSPKLAAALLVRSRLLPGPPKSQT